AQQPGVAAAAVNLATKTATVRFDPAATTAARLAETVDGLGYHARVRQDDSDHADHAADAHDHSAGALRRRTIAAAALSAPVVVMAMSHGAIPAFDTAWSRWLQ